MVDEIYGFAYCVHLLDALIVPLWCFNRVLWRWIRSRLNALCHPMLQGVEKEVKRSNRGYSKVMYKAHGYWWPILIKNLRVLWRTKNSCCCEVISWKWIWKWISLICSGFGAFVCCLQWSVFIIFNFMLFDARCCFR